MKTVTFQFNGHDATVIIPEKPNGKWIWKTEFLHAFEASELALLERGYTRVYYHISDMYGSQRAVRLMHNFHLYLIKNFSLNEKCILFGFSRGGLYAFNYLLSYPEYVEKIYLDAPVLDMRTWPTHGTKEREGVYREYGLTKESIETFGGHPIENLSEFFSHGIPTLLIAGDADEVVPFPQNSERMLHYATEAGIKITSIVKPGCKHHPHSVEEDVTPIVRFVETDRDSEDMH